ncbi:M14 family metallocarboxypeptidase [Shewanella pealeana]|uniref:Peptidase M14 domain-containing protein n=1 Tax=Shewanella pealeana (strain ATCC 700345 / ANG-SQ1) TaxID=398579 RepID=A8H2T7_SHEPA|nr:M14 family metallocarboxypeptidase [Shewanella pealeana]ABV86874.1 conserved hypothetical protein [Shewanella pealeana ATCC 700345]
MDQQAYAIGVKGQKWGGAEKAQWFNAQKIKRSYQEEVVSKILGLKDRFELAQYGSLSYDVERYPLFAVKSLNWDMSKPTILVTGGVHGYETSGVQGAIRFIETQAADYAKHFNIVVAPCISPWGYETINRWNPNAVDPNRSFYQDSPAEESAALMTLLAGLGAEVFAHIDLHETTDTDNSEFRPALAARDAVEHTNWNIPDGFYLVGDTINPQDAFQTAMIKSVEQVTHIAPADESGKLIGVELAQFGVINYATKALGLCAGVTDAKYVTTTEVYPDSPLADDENCILAQVAAITGGLDYLLTL